MGWLIFIDILLIIVLALMLSVTVNVHLNDETRIKIRYAGITIFSVSPEDEKHKKQKKSKEKQKKSPDDKSDNISADNEKPVQNAENTADKANGSSDISKESKKTHKVGKKADNNGNNGLLSKLGLSGDISETIEFVKQLILSASKPIKRLISHIRVSNFYLFVTASGEDAAQAAMNYGKIIIKNNDEAHRTPEIHSMLVIPLWEKGVVTGTLKIYYCHAHQITSSLQEMAVGLKSSPPNWRFHAPSSYVKWQIRQSFAPCKAKLIPISCLTL